MFLITAVSDSFSSFFRAVAALFSAGITIAISLPREVITIFSGSEEKRYVLESRLWLLQSLTTPFLVHTKCTIRSRGSQHNGYKIDSIIYLLYTVYGFCA